MHLSSAARERVRRIAEGIRERHPEFVGGVSWDGLRRVLAREGVLFAQVPLARPAKLMGDEGIWIILVDSARPARHLFYTLHEYAHLKLHVDHSATGRYEACFHMDDVVGDDPRELEADLLAELLMYGWER